MAARRRPQARTDLQLTNSPGSSCSTFSPVEPMRARTRDREAERAEESPSRRLSRARLLLMSLWNSGRTASTRRAERTRESGLVIVRTTRARKYQKTIAPPAPTPNPSHGRPGTPSMRSVLRVRRTAATDPSRRNSSPVRTVQSSRRTRRRKPVIPAVVFVLTASSTWR